MHFWTISGPLRDFEHETRMTQAPYYDPNNALEQYLGTGSLKIVANKSIPKNHNDVKISTFPEGQ